MCQSVDERDLLKHKKEAAVKKRTEFLMLSRIIQNADSLNIKVFMQATLIHILTVYAVLYITSSLSENLNPRFNFQLINFMFSVISLMIIQPKCGASSVCYSDMICLFLSLLYIGTR